MASDDIGASSTEAEADPDDVAEGDRLKRELESASERNDEDALIDIAGQITTLILDRKKWPLREKLIEKDIIVTISNAIDRQWPTHEQLDEEDTEVFEELAGLLPCFCVLIHKYKIENRLKFAEGCIKVTLKGLVLPDSCSGAFNSAWEEMFQYANEADIKKGLEDLSRDHDEGKVDTLEDKIDQSRIGKGAFSKLDYIQNIPMVPMGFVLDLIQFPAFIHKKDYVSLTILLIANLFKGLAPGFLCQDESMWKVPSLLQPCLGKKSETFWRVHNFCTFGCSGMAMQLNIAFERRQKMEDLSRMRIFAIVTSSVSFIIAGGSMLIQPYDGLERLKKWASIAYNIYSMSDSALTLNKSVLYGFHHYYHHSTHQSNVCRKALRKGKYFGIPEGELLRAFHVAEVLGILIYLPMEYTVTFSLLFILFVEACVVVGALARYGAGKDEHGVGLERWKLAYFGPSYMWANPLLGVSDHCIAFNLFVVVVRPIPWVVAWLVFLMNWETWAGAKDFTTVTGNVYLVLAGIGLVLYVFTAYHFYKLGLWIHGERESGV